MVYSDLMGYEWDINGYSDLFLVGGDWNMTGL